MAPTPGSIHRRPRRDSKIADLWPWIRARRSPWTADAAALAISASPRRVRAVLRAMAEAGLISVVEEAERHGKWTPARWSLTEAGRGVTQAPILIVDRGSPVGVRIPAVPDSKAALEPLVAEKGLVSTAAHLRVHLETLHGLLDGSVKLMTGDPAAGRIGPGAAGDR